MFVFLQAVRQAQIKHIFFCQRVVRRLNAELHSKIEAGRSFAGPGNANEYDVSIFVVAGACAIIIVEGKIDCVYAVQVARTIRRGV